MTVETQAKRVQIIDIAKGGTPVACLTAYTAPMAKLLDPHVDILLVGDSLGMVVYGFDSTRSVTLDMMIAHGAAVVRASSHALIVVDMPFGSYEQSPEQALQNARRVIKETGCGAVKLEGGSAMAGTVRYLVRHNVPVMGHIGLLPQSVATLKGFKIQGRDNEQTITQDAQAIAASGAFAMVIEGTIERVARAITQTVAIPTIGIGASPACDGQVLVIDDVLGVFTDFMPRFVKRYADLAPLISKAAAAYAADVRARRFPGPEHCFGAK